jgi:hypothetical protein
MWTVTSRSLGYRRDLSGAAAAPRPWSGSFRLHADLTILGKLAYALARARAVPLPRVVSRRIATEPPPAPAKRGRLPRRPRHFAPYRLAHLILIVLVLIGVIAIALLVVGLLNVDIVTDRFRIH